MRNERAGSMRLPAVVATVILTGSGTFRVARCKDRCIPLHTDPNACYLQAIDIANAFSTTRLTEASIQTLSDLTALSPGLRFSAEGGAGNTNVSLRGLSKARKSTHLNSSH